ncbi:hypothetical protein VIGAN_06040500, partial [Vigna angularis var. angularis]
ISTLNLTFILMLLIVDALEKDNVVMVWLIQLYNYVYTSSGLLAAGVLVFVGVGNNFPGIENGLLLSKFCIVGVL